MVIAFFLFLLGGVWIKRRYYLDLRESILGHSEYASQLEKSIITLRKERDAWKAKAEMLESELSLVTVTVEQSKSYNPTNFSKHE